MNRDDVKWLQVENTTRCNLWCPACARNIDGHKLSPFLVIEDLPLERFKEVLLEFNNLETIQFCGTFGDVMASKLAWEYIALAKEHCKKIQIHTHGGFRNTKWWSKLAKFLSDIDHDVWFALDGLKGVHEIYRQGSDFDKSIANAQSFIDAGGSATWQFIPWAHNEHQILECIKLSQQLKFKKFKLVKSVRDNFNARHWKSNETIEFRPWKHDKQFNKNKKDKNLVLEKDCMHLSWPGVYLNANGKLSSCCEFNISRQFDRFDQLPNIRNELATQPHRTCLRSCGTPAIISNYDPN